MSHVSVVGLGFGDEGKGTITDHLCRTRPVDYVVRFNGGGQAAHNVVTPEGVHHTFAHFGSGTLAGVSTVLSRFMVINPLGLQKEAHALAEKGVDAPRDSLYIDCRALLTLPPHVGLLKARERARGEDKHGSTNFGLAEVMRFALDHPDKAIRVEDLYKDPKSFMDKYMILESWARGQAGQSQIMALTSDFASAVEQRQLELRAALGGAHILPPEGMAQLLGSARNLVFEGAQGVLLDEWRGFHPHTTWSTTTFENVYVLLAEWGNPHPVEKLGVLRSYHTRHGYGPFPTYDPDVAFEEDHNKTEGGMGAFRAGHFDQVLARYAIIVCGGVDSIALTHMDRADQVKVCTRYAQEWGLPITFLNINRVKTDLKSQEDITKELYKVEPVYLRKLDMTPMTFLEWSKRAGEHLGAPVVIESWGPGADQKKDLTRSRAAATV